MGNKVKYNLKNVHAAKLTETVVEGVEFVPGKDRKVASLAKVINDKYANLHVVKNDGIIGDDTNKKEKKDNAESGEPADASLLRFALGKEERFYGGGSTSREHIQHRGELLRMWTTYQHTEIPMPFVMSSRGWGVFNNATRKNFFDIGYTEKTYSTSSIPLTRPISTFCAAPR